MKLRFGLVILVAGCALVGCHTAQPPATQQLLTGNYSFVSEDPESRARDHNLNHLVLKSDGTYDLIEGGTIRATSEKKGVWRIEPGWMNGSGQPPNVVLDHSGYPIEITRSEIRLLIDLDTGIWWVKPR